MVFTAPVLFLFASNPLKTEVFVFFKIYMNKCLLFVRGMVKYKKSQTMYVLERSRHGCIERKRTKNYRLYEGTD